MTGALRLLVRGADALARAGVRLGALALLAVFAVVVYAVAFRYFFGKPQSWADEIAGWLVVATVMLAAAADAAAQAQVRQREQVQQRTQEKAGWREIIPGSELMTSAEREAYRQRYAAAKTDADREKVRAGG